MTNMKYLGHGRSRAPITVPAGMPLKTALSPEPHLFCAAENGLQWGGLPLVVVFSVCDNLSILLVTGGGNMKTSGVVVVKNGGLCLGWFWCGLSLCLCVVPLTCPVSLNQLLCPKPNLWIVPCISFDWLAGFHMFGWLFPLSVPCSLFELCTVAKERSRAMIITDRKTKAMLIWKLIVEVLQSTLRKCTF